MATDPAPTEPRSADPDRRAGRRAGTAPGTRAARTKVAALAVVCRKCARRQGLRPGDLRALLERAAERAAKQAAERAERSGAGRPARRKVRVVASGCLGPCPKRAVAVATGASIAAGRVLLIDPAADPEAILAAILDGPGSPRGLPEFGPNGALAAGRPDESTPS